MNQRPPLNKWFTYCHDAVGRLVKIVNLHSDTCTRFITIIETCYMFSGKPSGIIVILNGSIVYHINSIINRAVSWVNYSLYNI